MTFVALPNTEPQAAILNTGFSYDYTNNILTDQNSGGLSWLSVNETRNRSYDDISSKFDVGQEFEGYRYATGQEVNELIGHWTGMSLTSPANTHVDDSIDSLILFIGDTYGNLAHELGDPDYLISNGLNFGADTERHYSFGIIADSPKSDFLYLSMLFDIAEKQSGPDTSHTYLHSLSRGAISGNVGSYLVKDLMISTVPLPAAFPLYGAAIAIMGFIGWRRKRRTNRS